MANLTNRQIISDIVHDLRALNIDDRVSKRYILHKLRDYAALYIKRDAEARRILGIDDLWTDVQCVELCEAPITDCCDIELGECDMVMRTRHKLPESIETLYKNLIQVFNVKYAKEFKQITPQEYKDILVREYKDNRIKYFWIQNGYLIIPDAMITTINIRGIFIDPQEAKKLSSCSEENEDSCISKLDQPFVCPDYLLGIVKQETLKDLFGFRQRQIVDENPNLNTNIKVNKDQ